MILKALLLFAAQTGYSGQARIRRSLGCSLDFICINDFTGEYGNERTNSFAFIIINPPFEKAGLCG